MEEITSDGHRLAAHFARPPGAYRVPALIVLPGFPRGTGGAALAGHTYPPLVDRVAAQTGWAALTFNYRGTGRSGGTFSIDGWLSDITSAIDALAFRRDLTGVWLAGFRLGGTLAVVTAAHDARVQGVATFAAPASLREWVRDPAWFLDYGRRVGVLRPDAAPGDPAAWVHAIETLDPVAAGARISPRPWLVVHGTRDDVVPFDDARRLAAAAPGRSTELRAVENGAHRLRHDPRAIAQLIGWLNRQDWGRASGPR
jgi:putative redox protein